MWGGGEIKIWLWGGSLLLGDIFPGLEGGDEQIFGWYGVDFPHPPSRENPAVCEECFIICYPYMKISSSQQENRSEECFNNIFQCMCSFSYYSYILPCRPVLRCAYQYVRQQCMTKPCCCIKMSSQCYMANFSTKQRSLNYSQLRYYYNHGLYLGKNRTLLKHHELLNKNTQRNFMILRVIRAVSKLRYIVLGAAGTAGVSAKLVSISI